MIVKLALSLLVSLCCSSAVLAEDFSLAGTVVSDDGQPLADVQVILIAPQMGFGVALTPPAYLETTTDGDGRFEMRVTDRDPRFLLPRDYLLVVHRSGYKLALEQFPPTRLLVDLPMDVRLSPATGSSSQLRYFTSHSRSRELRPVPPYRVDENSV